MHRITQKLSQRQVSWLAAAVCDHTRPKLSAPALELFGAYVELGGWCKLSNRELSPMLATRRRGDDGAKHASIRSSRRELVRNVLIACDQKPYDPPRRNPKTHALLVEPYEITITASSDCSFRWLNAGEWISRVLAANLRPCELKVALYLAAHLDTRGTLSSVTRDDLARDFGVHRDTAIRTLQKLTDLRLLRMSSAPAPRPTGLGRRPVVYSIVAQVASQLATHVEATVEPATASQRTVVKRTTRGTVRPLDDDDDLVLPVLSAIELAPYGKRTRATQRDLEEQLAKLAYPELVQDAITQAKRNVIAGVLPPSSIIKFFVEPVVELQESFAPKLVEYALRETITVMKMPGDLRQGTWNRSWCNYAKSICERQKAQHPTRWRPRLSAAPVVTAPVITEEAGGGQLVRPAAEPDIAPPAASTSATEPSEQPCVAADAPTRQPARVVRINLPISSPSLEDELRRLAAAHPGPAPVWIVRPDGSEAQLLLRSGGELRVAPSPRFRDEVRAWKQRSMKAAAA